MTCEEARVLLSLDTGCRCGIGSTLRWVATHAEATVKDSLLLNVDTVRPLESPLSLSRHINVSLELDFPAPSITDVIQHNERGWDATRAAAYAEIGA